MYIRRQFVERLMHGMQQLLQQKCHNNNFFLASVPVNNLESNPIFGENMNKWKMTCFLNHGIHHTRLVYTRISEWIPRSFKLQMDLMSERFTCPSRRP